MPALIDIFTDSGDAVEDVATTTLTAIGAHKVNTAMASTYTIRLLTLINVHTTSSLLIEVVPTATAHRVPLAGVGTHCVEAHLSCGTGPTLAQALIDVYAAAQSILYVALSTLRFGPTAERSRNIQAFEKCRTVVCASLAFINVFALVAVSQLIACSTADIALAAVRAKRVDASFPRPTAVAAQQALVYIFTGFPIWFEFKPCVAGTGAITYTYLTTLGLFTQAVGICGVRGSLRGLKCFVRLFIACLGAVPLQCLVPLCTAGAGHQTTLVAHREIMVTGQSYLLCCLPQQAAVTAHLSRLCLTGAPCKKGLAGTLVLSHVYAIAAAGVLQHCYTALLLGYSAGG